MRSKAAADRLRCTFGTVAGAYSALALTCGYLGDWYGLAGLTVIASGALWMRRVVKADDFTPMIDPRDDLSTHIAKAIDVWHVSHRDVTIGEIQFALESLSNLVTEAAVKPKGGHLDKRNRGAGR